MTVNDALPATAPTRATAAPAGIDGKARAGSLATRRTAAALLMVAGIGWNAGLEARPFHPVLVGVTALAVHVLPLVAVMFLVLRAQRSGLAGAGQGRGVSIAAAVALAFGVFSVLFSVTHPHAQMGIHTINDVLPIAILDAGALLWLLPARRAAVRTTR
jgi:hydrogenase-4 membrane subunit HyfE